MRTSSQWWRRILWDVPQDFWGNALFSVTPTILVGLLFWFVMRAVVRSDRSEREAFSKAESSERARIEAEERERLRGGSDAG
jgi:flagellar biosynthesis/type III secretory pathway M-ring protein FliF/YscJ